MTDYIAISQKLTKKEFHSLLDELCEKYYNRELDETEDVLDDETYDRLTETYKIRFKEEYKQIGATPRHKEKVKLDFFLASLDKVKTEKELVAWVKNKKGPFLREVKLDGVSCEYVCKKVDGKWIYTLRTRGNGVVGTNISHLLEYLTLPKPKENFACRGEIVMSRETFAEKYKDEKANPRNMVAGLVNSKHYEISQLKDLDVVMYQVLSSKKGLLKPSEQLDLLASYDFMVAQRDVPTKDNLIDIKGLQEHYMNWESTYTYDIDGTVIYEDIAVEWPKNKNPTHAIAFKVNTYCITTVTRVEYRASKHSKLKPRVWFDSVFLSGAMLKKATGHNANYIYKNNINVGTIIEVSRSGKVIPYIHRVIHPSDSPYMPEGEEGTDWNWNSSHVDIVLLNAGEDVEIKRIKSFFEVMDVKYLGPETIKKLYLSGFDSLKKLFEAEKDDFLEIEGIKEKSAQRTYDAIQQSITDVTLLDMMAASGAFGIGFGRRKLEPILDTYPNIMDLYENEDYEDIIDRIMEIKGFADTTATQFADGLYDFHEFLEEHQHLITFEKDEEDEDGPIIVFESDEEDEDKGSKESISGKTIVFTGIRDKELEKQIKKLGGNTKTTVSKNTNIVVTKERYSNSSKELKADELNIPVYTLEEFCSKYRLKSE